MRIFRSNESARNNNKVGGFERVARVNKKESMVTDSQFGPVWIIQIN
jgi:hypothetical protein